jgi:hypothetical protein
MPPCDGAMKIAAPNRGPDCCFCAETVHIPSIEYRPGSAAFHCSI